MAVFQKKEFFLGDNDIDSEWFKRSKCLSKILLLRSLPDKYTYVRMSCEVDWSSRFVEIFLTDSENSVSSKMRLIFGSRYLRNYLPYQLKVVKHIFMRYTCRKNRFLFNSQGI